MAESKIRSGGEYTSYFNSHDCIVIIRNGRACQLNYNNTTINLQPGWRELTEIVPVGYRPIYEDGVRHACFCGKDRNIPCLMHITANGSILLYNTSDQLQVGVYGASVMYMAK